MWCFKFWPIFQKDVIASKLDVLWFLIHSTQKNASSRPSHVITPTKFIHVALRRFCARILSPFVHFFCELGTKSPTPTSHETFYYQPTPHPKPPKTVEDDSYKLRTSYAEKSTNSPPPTLGIPWDSLHKTRKPALGGGVTTWRCCELRVWKKHRLLRGLDESYLQIVGKAFKMTILWGVYIYIYYIYIYWIQLCIIIIVTSYAICNNLHLKKESHKKLVKAWSFSKSPVVLCQTLPKARCTPQLQEMDVPGWRWSSRWLPGHLTVIPPFLPGHRFIISSHLF